MGKVHVSAFGISLDGFSAGPDQSLEHPLGVNGTDMMAWFFPTKTFIEQHGGQGGETGIDNDFAAKSMTGTAHRKKPDTRLIFGIVGPLKVNTRSVILRSSEHA